MYVPPIATNESIPPANPVPAALPAPPPAVTTPAALPAPLRRSGRLVLPTVKRAALDGIPHIPSVAKAVADSKESAERVVQARAASRALKAQRVSNHEEC
jgi:hypothetical protein